MTAAIDLADERGLAAVSMRALAAELGVGPMSLYTYVPTRDVLVALMIDHVTARTPMPGPAPTVVESRSTTEPVWRDEVFGPVVAVLPFDDEDEAIALANDTEYGLSGSIFTGDVGRALRVSRGEDGTLRVKGCISFLCQTQVWRPAR